MSCPEPICRLISCPVTDDIPSYIGAFNLQNGLVFTNALISVPNASYPGGFYYQPPGTITIPVPPGATSISYQGCKSTVSAGIPPGSTPAQIQSIISGIMQQVAGQTSICNAPPSPNPTNPSYPPAGGSPPAPPVFQNNEVSASCSMGLLMNLIGSLPNGVEFSIIELTAVAGIFSGGSQADADTNAESFLDSLIASGTVVQCGYWNEPETVVCANGTVQNIPAFTVFSTISQADADAKAIDIGRTICGGLAQTSIWTLQQNALGSGGTSDFTPDGSEGNIGFVTAITSPPFSGAIVDITGNFSNPCSHSINISIAISATGGAAAGNGFTVYIFYAGGLVYSRNQSTPFTDTPSFTIGAGGLLVINLHVLSSAGNPPVGGTNTITATLTSDLSC